MPVVIDASAGTVTGISAGGLPDGIVREVDLEIDNSPTNDYVLTAKSSASGGLTWAELAGAGVSKAWVNFDGTAGSISPRSSHNVSSITDNGTGDYTINFTNNMPNTNYIVVGYAASPNSRYLVVGDEAWTRTFAVGSARISVSYVSGTNGETTECDGEQIYLVFFGG